MQAHYILKHCLLANGAGLLGSCKAVLGHLWHIKPDLLHVACLAQVAEFYINSETAHCVLQVSEVRNGSCTIGTAGVMQCWHTDARSKRAEPPSRQHGQLLSLLALGNTMHHVPNSSYNLSSRLYLQAWWSELVTDGGAPPGRFAHAAVGAGETMYMVGGYAQGSTQSHLPCHKIATFMQVVRCPSIS